jgi:hypothetical protein
MSRNFNVPSGEMLQQSRAVRQLFNGDKALFSAFDTNLSDPYTDDWLASIEASEGYETDEQREDILHEMTVEVEAAMKAGRTAFKTAKYYIELAFADKPESMAKFGLDDYEEAAYNQSKFATFLTLLYKQCKIPANETKLMTAGMTLLQIEAINTAVGNFTTKDETQDSTKMATTEATQARDKQYNETYAYWQRVNRASKVIFDDDPVKLNQYKMPEGPQPDPDINFKGKVLDALNNTPLKNVVVKISELDIETTTNYAGNFNFVSLPAGTYTVRFVLAGYVTQDVPVTILASGVVVQNVSLTVN